MTGIKNWQIFWAVAILAFDFLFELFGSTYYVRNLLLTERHWVYASFWKTMTMDGRFLMAAVLGVTVPAVIMAVVAGLAYMKIRNWYSAATLSLTVTTFLVLAYAVGFTVHYWSA